MLLRALGIQGDIPGDVSSVMSPGLTIDDFTRPEYWWLRRGQMFGTFGTVAALAGNFSLVQMRAPVAIGRTPSIAIIENVIVTNLNAAAQTVFVGLGVPTGLTSTLGICKTDSRQFSSVLPGGISQFQIETFQVGVAINVFGQLVRVPPAQSMVVPGTWILDNEQGALGWIVTGQAVNASLTVSFQWRERPLLPQEI